MGETGKKLGGKTDSPQWGAWSQGYSEEITREFFFLFAFDTKSIYTIPGVLHVIQIVSKE